ncbi:hypothetical protein SMACR_01324 [Sordaria macrospora]|uniref:WGS project CABT00000000 data, contig 2.4 n=2 Tax=Sordaria macrospora TaxID=5147 RepID=F7VQH5_SORMK|nr:uncharacterized protein SMAC_01324 [Sordaria macrospora k-hell]KAA8633808.1 hypothetical protein SMACR_01324 [Sordaria macrospora]WPJ58796.1 hypothetical protein SMAC4_01324 [Sordaria macrospora]CCC07757.1 unnamed protein product [Sordaria macrospora k-hell]
MLCIPITTSHHNNRTQNRKMLRSFRSHKGLRSGHSSSKVQHARQPSDASSMDSRSSTTSSNGRNLDFDPLRCHPPDLTFTHRPSLGNISEDEFESHRPVRPSRSLPGPPHHSERAHYTTTPRVHHQPPTTPTTIIYDGFDFGFDHNKPTPPSAPAHHLSAGVATPSSPTPSTDSFSSSFSSASSDSVDSHYCAGLAAAPQPRHQRPRPEEVSAAMARPRGLVAADDFIKRGGWKRRGVIFELDVPMADEEECFDLDMD